MSETTAYPLCWPSGWPRAKVRNFARYKVTPDTARWHMLEQLRMMSARQVILSTNVALRRDGQPYANGGKITDPGAAVYFQRNGQTQVIACDKWNDVADNIRAIGLTVEALRGITRAGATELLDRAFTGFKALPAAGGTEQPWWSVLGITEAVTREVARLAYRALAREHHPDIGGDAARMAAINRAWEQAQAVLP